MSDRTQSAYGQTQVRRDELTVIVNTVDQQRTKYEGILPSTISWDSFRNAFLIAVQSNWRLLEADRQSLFLALQKAAGDGLKPDGREGALVIFGDDEEDEAGNRVPSKANQKKRVVWMPMVRGLIKLVRNTGQVAAIDSVLVYEGEKPEIWWEDGERHFRLHRAFGADFNDDPARIIGAIAIIKYKDGNFDMEPMSRRQIDRVRAISRAKKGPWVPWYDEMARKSVLRRLIKRVDQSPELRKLSEAIEGDETLNTIEGERPVETAPARAIAAEMLRQEFQGEAAKTGTAATASRSTPPATEAAPAATTAQWTAPASAAADDPRDDPRAANLDSRPEFWPSDEIGEPIEKNGEPMMFTTALAFAEWFAETYPKVSNREAFRENNADPISEASLDPRARAIIEAAIKVDAESEERGGSSTTDALVVPIPRTPGGKEHWPNYAAACGEAIGRIPDEAGLDAWIEANRLFYGGRAIEAKIHRHLAQRRADLSRAVQTGLPLAAEKDPERERAERMIADLDGLAPTDVRALAQNPAIKEIMTQWRQERSELFQMVKAAFDKAAGETG